VQDENEEENEYEPLEKDIYKRIMPYKEDKKNIQHILSILKIGDSGSTDGTPDDGLAF
jgi:putative IMPACT (imprinted ancient) family translation regulator